MRVFQYLKFFIFEKKKINKNNLIDWNHLLLLLFKRNETKWIEEREREREIGYIYVVNIQFLIQKKKTNEQDFFLVNDHILRNKN